jgi:hypothetical protein
VNNRFELPLFFPVVNPSTCAQSGLAGLELDAAVVLVATLRDLAGEPEDDAAHALRFRVVAEVGVLWLAAALSEGGQGGESDSVPLVSDSA